MPFVPNDHLEHLTGSGEYDQLISTHLPLGTAPKSNNIFFLPDADRYRTTYILGKAGTGKSSLLENMVHWDALVGNPVIVLDPHGDLADNCVAALPLHRVKHTFTLDLLDETHPFTLNVFAHEPFTTSAEHRATVERITCVFKMLWPQMAEGQYLPRYLRRALIAILDLPEGTLVDMYRMLTDDGFLQSMLPKIKDADVRRSWEEYHNFTETERLRRISPLLERLHDMFEGNSLARNLFGSAENGIDWRGVIQRKELLFVKLHMTTLGDVARLVGTIMVSQIAATVFSFSNLPLEQRPSVSLFLDEYQKVATEDIARLVTEGRKFGLKLTLAHQYRTQTSKDLQEATANAHTKICFAINADDASKMAPYFQSKGTRVKEVEEHPVKYLCAHAFDFPQDVQMFIHTYLAPVSMESHRIDIEQKTHDINWGKMLLHGVPKTVMSGAARTEVQWYETNPTGFMDHLLYEVMSTGQTNQAIRHEIVRGYANCLGGFYKAAQASKGQAVLLPRPDYPAGCVTQMAKGYLKWTKEPRTQWERLYHFVFHLRLTMEWLSTHPVGKLATTSQSDVAQMLVQLPKRAAFVSGGGTIYTHPTPDRVSADILRDRLVYIRDHTRKTYCHPRPEIQHVGEVAVENTPTLVVPSRWQEVKVK